MAQVDYYEVLGVDRDADEEEIKRAYRRVAKECHPDVTQGDENATERFRRATEAYEVLSDRERRAAYDRDMRQQEALRQGRQDAGAVSTWEFFRLAEEMIWNMFRELHGYPAWESFGGHLEILLSPEEAFSGTRVSFDVPIERECGICEGHGFSVFGVCPRCRGTGRVEGSRRITIEIPAGVRDGDHLRLSIPTGTRVITMPATVRVRP